VEGSGLRSRVGWLAAVGLLAAAAAPGRAGAVVVCTYTASTHVAEVRASGEYDNVILKRSGTQLLVNGAACSGALTTNTSRISVLGTFKHQSVKLDLGGGALAPGWGAKPGVRADIAEIKLALALYDGTPVTITGGPGADTIRAGKSGVLLDRDSDVDLTISGGSLVAIDGGAGDDNLSAGGGDATGAPLGNAVNITGGAGNDTLVGGDRGERLDGGDGSDKVDGGAGDDVLVGGAHASPSDRYTGGPGADRLDYSAQTKRVGVCEDVTGSICSGYYGFEFDYVTGVETVLLTPGDDMFLDSASPVAVSGGAGNDVLNLYFATGDGNVLDGGAGNDHLYGGKGGDTLVGGPGNDDEYGFGGADRFVMGSSPDGNDAIFGEGGAPGPDHFHDVVDYSQRSAPITVDLNEKPSGDLAAGERDTVYHDVEEALGGTGDDTFVGNDFANTFYGNAGKDSLTGGKGQDLLHGGPGDDVYHAVDGFQDFIFTGGGNDNVSDIDVGLDVVASGAW